MKYKTLAMVLVVGFALSNHANAVFIYNANTQILTDTQGARMWLLHGIGFASSYPYPEFANTWITNLNQQQHGGYADWRLPSVASGDPTPLALSGDLGQLFSDLSAAYPNRDDWPWGLGSTVYGGNLIFTDLYADDGRYWGMSFGDGGYQSLYCGFAYPYVGVMAVHELTGSGLSGDFDDDGDVDGYDFLLWQRGESPNPLSATDLADWQNTYGAQQQPLATTSVPEPATAMMLLLAAVGIYQQRK